MRIGHNKNMIVIAGASASGKTEVAKLLAKKYGINKIITTTTRPMRIHEVNGRDYFFISKEEFERKIAAGDFVEYTVYNGNLYGSTKDQIADNKCVVIDPAGLRSYIALKDEKIVTFFLEADEETRRKRMIERGDDPQLIESRILHDREAFKKENIAKVDYTIDSSMAQSVEDVCDDVYNKYISRK